MDVVKNMLFAEAVIACTAGTVAELQIWEIGVCAAADLTFMAISLFTCFFLLLPDGGVKVNGLMGTLMPGPPPPIRDFIRNIRPEKDKEI